MYEVPEKFYKCRKYNRRVGYPYKTQAEFIKECRAKEAEKL